MSEGTTEEQKPAELQNWRIEEQKTAKLKWLFVGAGPDESLQTNWCTCGSRSIDYDMPYTTLGNMAGQFKN